MLATSSSLQPVLTISHCCSSTLPAMQQLQLESQLLCQCSVQIMRRSCTCMKTLLLLMSQQADKHVLLPLYDLVGGAFPIAA
jgi:hypothetical protein